MRKGGKAKVDGYDHEYNQLVKTTLNKEVNVQEQISQIVIENAVQVNNSFTQDIRDIYKKNLESYQEDENFKNDQYKQKEKLAYMKFEIEYADAPRRDIRNNKEETLMIYMDYLKLTNKLYNVNLKEQKT